jgi:hypothetical protein
LAWITETPEPGILGYYRLLVEGQVPPAKPGMFRYRPPTPNTDMHLWDPDEGVGREAKAEPDGTFVLTEREARFLLPSGWNKLESAPAPATCTSGKLILALGDD